MRQVIDIERRGCVSGWYIANFTFVVTFINGDFATYLLQYNPELREFSTRKERHWPKDLKRLAHLKRLGRTQFTITVPLVDHLKSLLTPKEMAECAAMSLYGDRRL